MLLNAVALNELALNEDAGIYVVSGAVDNPLAQLNGLIGVLGESLGDCTQPSHDVSGSAFTTTVGTASITDYNDQIAGTIASSNFLFGNCNSPIGVVSSISFASNFGNCFNPSQTISGALVPGGFYIGEMTQAVGDASATIIRGYVGVAANVNNSHVVGGVALAGALMDAAIEQPASEVEITTGLDVALEGMQAVVAAVMRNGTVMHSSLTHAVQSAEGFNFNNVLIAGAVTNLPVSVVGYSVGAGVSVGDALQSIQSLSCVLLDGEVADGNVDADIQSVSAWLFSTGAIAGAVVDARESVLGFMRREIDAANAESYAMNMDNRMVSRYPSFAALAFGMVGHNFIIAAPDGIYVMDGDLDGTDAIDARVRFGAEDFGSEQLKRLQYAYVGARGEVTLSMLIDGDQKTGVYEASHAGDGLRTTRIKMGKGSKSRYWQPEIRGRGDLAIESLSLEPEVLSRRVA